MNDRLIRVRAVTLALLACMTAVVWLAPYLSHAERTSTEFSVTFLNVGQGDAVLIQTPDGIDVLIDGGPGRSVLAELAAVLGPFDRTIDMVVATHPDADHIGGLIDVLERYEVETILMTENESDSDAADAYESGVSTEGAEVVYARAGQTFALGASTTMHVLFPAEDPHGMESNASSIVVKVSYGESDFLLTGDAPKRIEAHLIATYGDALASEVLKAGHHGSRTSSADAFVATVDPDYAVISAGADNSYGHPHDAVLETFEEYGVNIAETADGRVTFIATDTGISQK